jgi:Nuf2, DHR10-like domain
MKKATTDGGASREIDLAEATRLVGELEHDLAKLRGGSEDLQSLRDEVEALRRVLRSPARDQGDVHRGLSNVRTRLENVREAVVDEAITVAEYVAQIGHMLGM